LEWENFVDDIWAFSIDQTFDLSLPAASLSVSLSAKDMVSQELRRRILLLLTPSLEKSTREEGKESGVAVTLDLQRILVFIFPFFSPKF
jgi:hypothetical protein